MPGYKTWGWGRGVVELGAAAVQRGVALDAEFFFSVMRGQREALSCGGTASAGARRSFFGEAFELASVRH